MGVMGDLVDLIRHRRKIYEAAFRGDLDRLRLEHGTALIDEALQAVVEEENLELARDLARQQELPQSRLIRRVTEDLVVTLTG